MLDQNKVNVSQPKVVKRYSFVQSIIFMVAVFCMVIMVFQLYFHYQLHLVSQSQRIHENDDEYSNIYFFNLSSQNSGGIDVGLKLKGAEGAHKGNNEAKETANYISNDSSNVDIKSKSSNTIQSNESRVVTNNCGCPATCTSQILESGNSNFSCRTRINKLMSTYGMDENKACDMASKASIDEVDESGLKPCPIECHPDKCHNVPKKKEGIDCGCPKTCNKRALNKRNKQFVCIDRILHLMNKKNLPELEACEAASQLTYNYNDTENIDINKPCEYECHPKMCKNMTTTPTFQNITNIDLPKEKFIKYDNAVIVTKVLSDENTDLLIQMLCLLNAAYNRFVHRDIIVFTTIPWSQQHIERVQHIVHPAKLQVVLEGKSIQEHLDEMTVEEIEHLNKRCNVKEDENITWNHHCTEDNSEHVSSLGYAWQAEFRSYHIWTHEALKPYKYMMWIDADAMCTKTWDYDPMKVMVDNDLILMYDQFPGGLVRGKALKYKIQKTYGENVCGVAFNEEKGILIREDCTQNNQLPAIKQVFGFHHITNLDVYRKEKHQQFLKELTNNGYRFSRLWDDQLAVTFPAVMEDPSRCWDYQIHGLHMGIHHNGRIDGKAHAKYTNYLNYWANDGKYSWSAGRAMCDGLVTVIS